MAKPLTAADFAPRWRVGIEFISARSGCQTWRRERIAAGTVSEALAVATVMLLAQRPTVRIISATVSAA